MARNEVFQELKHTNDFEEHEDGSKADKRVVINKLVGEGAHSHKLAWLRLNKVGPSIEPAIYISPAILRL